jgi:hypothetical protein
MGKVAALGCVVCDMLGNGHIAAQVHHIREGQGMSQRASNWLTIPLCPECHTGPNGIHGDRNFMKILKVDELDLLAVVIAKLSGSKCF